MKISTWVCIEFAVLFVMVVGAAFWIVFQWGECRDMGAGFWYCVQHVL